MGQVRSPIKVNLPSFSLILETENLANADINGLSKSLASLINQDIPPTCANEVLLIESGDVPQEKLEQIHRNYPWIQIHQASLETSYYQAKMLGAKLVTGEIVVYCDSDCIYEPSWLRSILTAFVQNDRIQIVAGETMTQGQGPYGTAMALAYIFPPYSQQQTLISSSQYFLNNVAFRREFLLQNPIPTEFPLYRGHCVIHAHTLQQQGHTIWQQPQARAAHAPPNGLSHFFWRFLLIGYDYYWQEQLLAKIQPQDSDHDLKSGVGGKLRIFGDRLRKILAYESRHLIYLPLALPIAMIAMAVLFAGYVITIFHPYYLLRTYNRILGETDKQDQLVRT